MATANNNHLSVFERMANIRETVYVTITAIEKLRKAVRVPKVDPGVWDSATDLRAQLKEAEGALAEAAELLKPLKKHHVNQYPARRAREVAHG